MRRYCNTILFFLFNLVIITVLASSTSAYVLQGPHILDLMVKKFGKVKSLYVSQKLILYDPSALNESVEFYQNLKYDFPEKFRSEILGENREWIYVRAKEESITVVDGKVVDFDEILFDRYTDILLYRSRNTLQRRLLTFGIDLSVSSLGRFQDRIVYLVGAKYPDKSKPQIWFDKDSFRPVRWIMMGDALGDGLETLDVTYMNWKQIDNAWYPMNVEFYQNGNKVREVAVVDIEVNPVFSQEQFEIDRIRSIYPSMSVDRSVSDESDPLYEIKKSIEDFKRIYNP